MSGVDLTGLIEKRNSKGSRYFEDTEGEIIAKQCTKCGEIRTLTGFSNNKKGVAGKEARCRECVSEYDRKYREENADKISEYHRKYREENADKISEYNRKRREENADYYRKYREENADRIMAVSRKYREENADRIMAASRKHYEENADYYRKYREENANKISEYNRKRREDNPELFKTYKLRRRARKRLLPDTIMESDVKEISLYFGEGCALTGGADVHMDHVLPLSIGHGGTTYENMIPLRDDLNISKNNRNLFEWFYEEKERFELSQARFDELIEYLADTNEMTTKEYRDFVYWCHDNPRTNEEIEADNERYGYMKPSSEIWREEVANKGRELVEVGV